MRIRYIGLVFISLIPLLALVLWFYNNSQYPGSDAVGYLSAALEISNTFKNNGFFDGLSKLYTCRSWRPVSFQLLAVPFLLISKNDLLFASACVHILCSFFVVVYAFNILNMKVAASLAVIGAASIALLTDAMMPGGHVFFAETALLPGLLATVYHLSKSEFLRVKLHSLLFVVWSIFSITIRPVEAITHLLLVYIFFLVVGYKAKAFSSAQLRLIFLAALLMSTLAIASGFRVHAGGGVIIPSIEVKLLNIIENLDPPRSGDYYKNLSLGLLGLLSASVVMSLFFVYVPRQKSLPQKTYVIPGFLSIFFGAFAWWIYSMPQLYEWVFMTSVGPVVGRGDLFRPSIHIFEGLRIYVLNAGIIPILLTTFILFIGFTKNNFKQKAREFLKMPGIYLLLLCPAQLAIVFTTIQTTHRKMSLVIPVLMLLFLLIGLQNSERDKIKKYLLLLIIFLQVIGSVLLSCGYKKDIFIGSIVGRVAPAPVNIVPNPHKIIINFLNKQKQTRDFSGVSVICKLDNSPICPFLLGLMAQEENNGYYASYPYIKDYSKESKNVMVARGADAIILINEAEEMEKSEKENQEYLNKSSEELEPNLKLYYEMRSTYAANKMSSYGWEEVDCFIAPKNGKKYKGCFFVKKGLTP